MAKDHAPEFLKLVQASLQNVQEIGNRESNELAQTGQALLIDVREDNEWNAGHATGATHMGRGIIERDIEKAIPDKQAKIICYCGGGFRSALVAESLAKMGYTNVLSMKGGWTGWKEAGLPME